jgi:hypothetical protein
MAFTSASGATVNASSRELVIGTVEGRSRTGVTEFAQDGARHPQPLGEPAGFVDACGGRPGRRVVVCVPQHGVHESDGGDAVAHRVVDADGDGLAAVRERPDHVERP